MLYITAIGLFLCALTTIINLTLGKCNFSLAFTFFSVGFCVCNLINLIYKVIT